MTRFDQKGFSLIELIIFIILGAIFIPASLVAFTTVMNEFLIPDQRIKARFYAQQKIEDLTRKSFGDITGSQSYIDSGYTGYQWKWTICNTGSSEINLKCSDAHNTGLVDYAYYKKIEVAVLPPNSPEYNIETIISKRPRP